jgi:hypothetical protein
MGGLRDRCQRGRGGVAQVAFAVVEETADQRRIQVARSSWQGRFPAVAEAKVSSGRQVLR